MEDHCIFLVHFAQGTGTHYREGGLVTNLPATQNRKIWHDPNLADCPGSALGKFKFGGMCNHGDITLCMWTAGKFYLAVS